MGANFFYHETIKRTVVAFGNLFNDIHIRKVDQGATDVINDMKVPLAYGPIQKFLARIAQQSELDQPTQITTPRMSFEMNALAYDGTRKVSPVQKFVVCEDGTKVARSFMPVPYNIGFELNIMTKLNEDSLQIIEQILPFFQPSLTVSVELVSSINEVKDIPFVLDSVTFTDDYEGDFSTRRVLIYTLQFTAKTYLYGPIDGSETGLIKKVQVDYYTDTNKNAAREVRYIAEITPPDAGPSDDFGFNEETIIFSDQFNLGPGENL